MSELPTFPPPNATSSANHHYQFEYPATLLTIPYHLDPTIPNLLHKLIPLSRATRHLPIDIPVQSHIESDAMDIEQNALSTQVELIRETATVESDGMLLYVAQASYEPGTSPLSLWVPVKAYTDERAEHKSSDTQMAVEEVLKEAPLDVFERCAASDHILRWSDSVSRQAHQEAIVIC